MTRRFDHSARPTLADSRIPRRSPSHIGGAVAAACLALGFSTAGGQQQSAPPASQPPAAQQPQAQGIQPPRMDDPSAQLRDLARRERAIDLLTLYREALENDMQFQSARFQYQATLERVPQARAGLLPNLNATGNYTESFPDSTATVSGASLVPPRAGTVEITGDNRFNNYGGGLNLSVPIYRPQNWELLEQAKLQAVQAESVLAQARQDLVVRVSNAYFNVLGARDQVIALESQRESTLQQLAQAKREFEVGTKTIIDTNEAQARYDQILAQLQVAVGTLIVRRNDLRAIVGRDPEVLAPLVDDPKLQLPQPNDANTWVKAAEEGNFSIRVARASAQIAEREVQRNRDGHKPTLDLVGGYNLNRSNGTEVTTFPTRSNTATVGVQLNVPIYSGGLIQSRVREALALQNRSNSELENTLRTATNSARSAFTGVNFGLTQVQALESAERSARTQLESTRLGYQVGVRIQLDVLNATTQLVATQRDLKRARYDFLLSGLNLKAAAGSLTEDDLRAVNALLTQPPAQ
jgi:outer membrane protein